MSGSLFWALISPAASADGLTDKRDKLDSQIAQTKQDLNESSKEFANAAVALDKAQAELDLAQDALAKTQAELAKAKQQDAAMAAKLAQAQADLAKAKADVAAGLKTLAAQKLKVGEMVRNQYQQQTNLLPIALVVESGTTADLQTRIQWSTTLFDTTQAQMDRLHELQRQLDAKKAHQAAVEQQVAADRAAAAASLKTRQALEKQAEQEKAAVAALVQQRAAASAAAQKQVASDKAQYAALTEERTAVEKRIAERIAKQKAAEAKRKAEAKKKREAAKKKAAKAKARVQVQSHQKSSSNSSAHHGFIYPVSAPITSPYGMRFHPILHYWKLHDGTDFGASCGTPIKAAYSGRVSERYYNAGYGNRLMIDHGKVDGRYVTTGYNHAIRYIVSVGQHVRQGQVIGYVGTTGYSTGCHLHLMVWLDGQMVNPMTWY